MNFATPQSVWRRILPDMATATGLALAPFVLPHLGFAADTMNRILVLGLFAFIVAPIPFGPIAWYLGHCDLAEIRAGRACMSDILC